MFEERADGKWASFILAEDGYKGECKLGRFHSLKEAVSEFMNGSSLLATSRKLTTIESVSDIQRSSARSWGRPCSLQKTERNWKKRLLNAKKTREENEKWIPKEKTFA